MTYLGSLVLLAANKADNFYSEEVSNNDAAQVSEALGENLVSDNHYINGFDNAGVPQAIDEYHQHFADLDLEIDGDSRIITGRFKDGGAATKEYTIKVYLIVEESAEVEYYEEEAQ